MSYYHPQYPDTPALKKAAKKRIPAFAFDYLCGGCHDEIGVAHNASSFTQVKLQSDLLAPPQRLIYPLSYLVNATPPRLGSRQSAYKD